MTETVDITIVDDVIFASKLFLISTDNLVH